MELLATYREPFSFAPIVQRLPEGETLDGMRARMRGLPDEFADHGVICINGQPVPRALWGLIRPKAPAVTEVTFHCPPRNGGGGDGKNVFAMVASIALTVVSGGIASGAILGGLTGAGQIVGGVRAGANIASIALAAGVSLAGSLLVSALIPPPSLDTSRGRDIRNPGAASADGNLLEPNAPIPRVIGERKVYPPLASEPLTYFDGPDEVVEAAYVLAGPHRIEDVRLGAASVGDVVDIDHEVREGWPGDPMINLIRRQARTEPVQSELRGFVLSPDDGRTIDSPTGNTASALPQVQAFATRQAPDEHQLQLVFGNGLHRNGSETAFLRVPLRMRMRPLGGAWINLPELHFRAANVRQMRATIRLVWTDDATAELSAALTEGWVQARIFSPRQTVAPASSDWEADPYFVDSGDVWMSANNLGSTGVRHVDMDRYTASILLDRAVFPPGRYEVEIRRGAAFLAANYSSAAYTYSGTVWDFWGVQGTPGQIVMSRDSVVDTLHILRSVSIWNEHPLPSRDLAVVAIRARNRAVDQVSCVAGGYVRDWDGTGWNDWTVTDNPAPHLRDIYMGAENLDPVPLDLIDDPGLVEWRQHCIDMSYTCNALIQDQTVDDAARIVASCGYAKPYMSDIWGVIRDYDRSAEAPVQVFSPRNMVNFQWTQAFARVPEGFRVNFRDASRDYDTHQISVFRPGHSDDSGRMEQVTLEGLVHEPDVIQRAVYDQKQAQIRSTFYSGTVSAESILVRRGDLVGVQHDMLTEWAGSARVLAVETDGSGDIVALIIDGDLPFSDLPDMLASEDLLAEDNLLMLGVQMGVAIRRSGAVTIHPVDGVTGGRVEFSPPIPPDGIDEGTLIVSGQIGQEYRRLIVFDISPKPNFEAAITFVDEAPQLWS